MERILTARAGLACRGLLCLRWRLPVISSHTRVFEGLDMDAKPARGARQQRVRVCTLMSNRGPTAASFGVASAPRARRPPAPSEGLPANDRLGPGNARLGVASAPGAWRPPAARGSPCGC